MKIHDQNGYRIINLTDGNKISDAVLLINESKADGINFNFICNYPSDIHLLRNAHEIKCVTINDYSWDFDYSAIYQLKNLESLSIYTSDKKEIDYSKFPLLKRTAIFWRPKAKSLFKCKGLESLFIGKFRDTDLTNISALQNLTYLRINTGSVQSLKGIESLIKLEELYLMQVTNLKSIKGIDALNNLKLLRIDNCRNITDIHRIAGLDRSINVDIIGTTPKFISNSD